MVEGPSLPPPAPSFQPTSHNPNSPDTAKVASRETNRHQLRTTLRRNCPISVLHVYESYSKRLTLSTPPAPGGEAQQVHVPKTWPRGWTAHSRRRTQSSSPTTESPRHPTPPSSATRQTPEPESIERREIGKDAPPLDCEIKSRAVKASHGLGVREQLQPPARASADRAPAFHPLAWSVPLPAGPLLSRRVSPFPSEAPSPRGPPPPTRAPGGRRAGAYSLGRAPTAATPQGWCQRP